MINFDPILRIFNKNHNNAIPFEIRQLIGLETGDLLSYTVTDTGDVLIHKIPVEECAPPTAADITSGDDPIINMLNSLTPEQQYAAITYLSIKYKANAEKSAKTT